MGIISNYTSILLKKKKMFERVAIPKSGNVDPSMFNIYLFKNLRVASMIA